MFTAQYPDPEPPLLSKEPLDDEVSSLSRGHSGSLDVNPARRSITAESLSIE